MSDLLPIEREWLAENASDPRPDCLNREAHAVRVYGNKWSEHFIGGYPKLDGRSVAKSHAQTLCSGCLRYTIWTLRTTS